MSSTPSQSVLGRLAGTAVLVALGTLLTATYFQTALSSRQLALNFVSPQTWFAIAQRSPAPLAGQTVPEFVNHPYTFSLIPCAVVAVLTWLCGGFALAQRLGLNWTEGLIRWGWWGWFWWCLVDVWEWVWIVAGGAGLESLIGILSVTPQFWFAGCMAGWMTTWLTLSSHVPLINSTDPAPWPSWRLWLACGLYVAIFTTMNHRLYANLLVPHGDSVMYEEHLWNLLHGKGFRSYLDRGLFFGEHIQFVHLFLIPIYAMWPSHLLLEACSSSALALGACPVFWMTRRHTQSDRLAFAAAVAYLLYFPMQFLDIEIDLKTFRPESFGIPLLLVTLDQLDRRHWLGTIVGILCCLTVKEDYTLIFGPLGLWIAFVPLAPIDEPAVSTAAGGTKPPFSLPHASRWSSRRIIGGLLLSLFSVAYLWLATRVIMPWFRSGDEVHYASYFARFGKTPEEILKTWVTQPGSVANALFTPDTAIYALALLAPLAFLPLLGASRLAVGFPLFAILCMNELEGSRTPQHQFHAPLVAVIFWALAAALPVASSMTRSIVQRLGGDTRQQTWISNGLPGRLLWTSSLATGLFFSLGPLGLPFWDSGSSWHWQKLYGTTRRAEMFSRIENLIPPTARVASTDFVHPRYTHHLRSYDYSDYQRKVSGTGRRIPEDTDYLVIDTGHKYSRIKVPSEIPERKEAPDDWELLPDTTEGLFIVLKRKWNEKAEARHEE